VDLYQIHAWDSITPVEETLSFLASAVRSGKVLYVGLSNYTGWQLQLMMSTAREMGVTVPVTLQQQYSLLSRESEWEVIPAALHNGVGLLPWSPLAGGFLAGSTSAAAPDPDTRAGSDKPLYQYVSGEYAESDPNRNTIDTVAAMANDRGLTPSQVAIAWTADKPSVTAPFNENLGAGDLHLDAEAMARLDAVSEPQPGGYPYGRFGRGQRERGLNPGDVAPNPVEAGSDAPLGHA